MKCILERQCVKVGVDLADSGQNLFVSFCEHDSESFGDFLTE
jgi:hypothetical protein